MLSLDFPSFHFFWGKSEKEFEKLFSRTAVSHVHACLAEKRLLFMTTVLQILLSDFKNHSKKGNPCIRDLDVISDIHLSSAWGRISQG